MNSQSALRQLEARRIPPAPPDLAAAQMPFDHYTETTLEKIADLTPLEIHHSFQFHLHHHYFESVVAAAAKGQPS